MDDEDLEVACEEVGIEHTHDGTFASMRAALRKYYSGGASNFSAVAYGSPAPAVAEFVLPPRPESSSLRLRDEDQGELGLPSVSSGFASERVSVYVQVGEPPDVEVVSMGLQELLQGVLDGELTEETLVVEADGRGAQPLAVWEEGWKRLEDCPELLEGPTVAAEHQFSPTADTSSSDDSHSESDRESDRESERATGDAVDGSSTGTQIWLQWPPTVVVPEGIIVESGEGDDAISTVSVSLEQLLELIMDGCITEDTMTYVEGGDDWAPLRYYGPVLGLDMDDDDDGEEADDGEEDNGAYTAIDPTDAPDVFFDTAEAPEQSGDGGSDSEPGMFYSVGGNDAIPIGSLAQLAGLVSSGKHLDTTAAVCMCGFRH